MKYRKKPVAIEAYMWQTELGNNRLMNWLSQNGVDIKGWTFFDDYLLIPTLEGEMKASPNDFIIIGVAGEVYPCKPDIFEQTYEEVQL